MRRAMKVDLLPYCEIDGIRTLKDSDIKHLYQRIEEAGVADIVFCGSDIKDAEGFLAAMKYKDNHLYVVLVDEKPEMIVWLNRFEGKFARFHWCPFKDLRGDRLTQVGMAVRDKFFSMKDYSGEYLYDMLMGIIPIENKPAIGFLKKIGVKELGILPKAVLKDGKSTPGVLMYYAREELDQ